MLISKNGYNITPFIIMTMDDPHLERLTVQIVNSIIKLGHYHSHLHDILFSRGFTLTVVCHNSLEDSIYDIFTDEESDDIIRADDSYLFGYCLRDIAVINVYPHVIKSYIYGQYKRYTLYDAMRDEVFLGAYYTIIKHEITHILQSYMIDELTYSKLFMEDECDKFSFSSTIWLMRDTKQYVHGGNSIFTTSESDNRVLDELLLLEHISEPDVDRDVRHKSSVVRFIRHEDGSYMNDSEVDLIVVGDMDLSLLQVKTKDVSLRIQGLLYTLLRLICSGKYRSRYVDLVVGTGEFNYDGVDEVVANSLFLIMEVKSQLLAAIATITSVLLYEHGDKYFHLGLDGLYSSDYYDKDDIVEAYPIEIQNLVRKHLYNIHEEYKEVI